MLLEFEGAREQYNQRHNAHHEQVHRVVEVVVVPGQRVHPGADHKPARASGEQVDSVAGTGTEARTGARAWRAAYPCHGSLFSTRILGVASHPQTWPHSAATTNCAEPGNETSIRARSSSTAWRCGLPILLRPLLALLSPTRLARVRVEAAASWWAAAAGQWGVDTPILRSHAQSRNRVRSSRMVIACYCATASTAVYMYSTYTVHTDSAGACNRGTLDLLFYFF